jgi:hypothetical protein
MKNLEFEHEYYPKDLQELARKAYEALPESGTVAQLVARILEVLPTRKREDGDQHSYLASDSYVEIGWKKDISTEPLGDEIREVIDVGTMQWFYEDEKAVMVCPNGRYVSHSGGANVWHTISDDQAKDYRELRWEIGK